MSEIISSGELVVSHGGNAVEVYRARVAGLLRPVGVNLYTSNLKDSLEKVVWRNKWWIVGAFYPGALVTDRTAIEQNPGSCGSVFVVHNERGSDLKLPGLRISPRAGIGYQETDSKFVNGLFKASTARALLENLKPSRARGGAARTIRKEGVLEYLDRLLRTSGEDSLNHIRDQAKAISKALNLEAEFGDLCQIIGMVLGTKEAKVQGPLGAAYLKRHPYDSERMEMFEALRAELESRPPQTRMAKPNDGDALPFFEAYFSNFIEGTEFTVDEAKEIIFDGIISHHRPQDSHDILGTFEVANNTAVMGRTPRSTEEFFEILESRHRAIMSSRPDKMPGAFKTRENRAGETVFVHPRQVKGTLAEAFALYRTLSDAFARAVMMKFIVAEVHPFADGNGRCARLLMNAELVAAGEHRIIIPSVFRGEYIGSLKALSHNHRPQALISVLDFAQRYTQAIAFDDIDSAQAQLTATHAFAEPMDAMGNGARLELPRRGIAR